MLLTDEYAGLCLMYQAIHGGEDEFNAPRAKDEADIKLNFDKDEIIPNGYESYESYLDDINDFLFKYQTIFTTKKYNSSQNIGNNSNSSFNQNWRLRKKSNNSSINIIKNNRKQKNKNDVPKHVVFLVESGGLEPSTFRV